MARKLYEKQAIRKRSGGLANGVAMVVYTNEAGTTPADISATLGGSAIAGSTVTTANIDGLGPASLRFYGPTDGTDTLWLRTPGDTSLGVQKIEADPDPRLDALESGSATGIPGSIFDAKGDLIAASAADTAARLGVGANGTVLTAASGQTTGLQWTTPDVTQAELDAHAADGTSIHGITDTAQLSVRELLSQAVIDAYEGRTLYLRTGTHTVATALNLHPDSAYVGDARDGTVVEGTSGQDVFLLPSSAITDYSYISLRDMSISGGRRQLSSTRLFTYLDVQRVTFAGPSAECVYVEGRVEEWYFDNIRMEGGTHGFRLAHVLADGLNYIDKSTFKDVTTFHQTVNGWRLEADGAVGDITWINPWIALSGEHGFYMDGGFRCVTIINANTEGNGDADADVVRTQGSIAAASASLTVAVAAFANGRAVTVRGAGPDGSDLSSAVASGAWTTSLTLYDTASTTVFGYPVTSAIYDDFHFGTSIGSPAQVQFIGGGLGLETTGSLRYAINNPGFEMLLVGLKTTASIPVYDPLGKTKAIGGAGPILQYGVESEMGNTTVLMPYHSTDVALIARAQLSQSVNTQEWQAYNGTVGVAVDAGQKLKFPTAQQAATANVGAATLPANPVGFFIVKDASGTDRKVPYYAT